MKIDVVITLWIERPINPNHARPRPEILPLLIVLKHHERDVAAEGEIDPVIRRFSGIYPPIARAAATSASISPSGMPETSTTKLAAPPFSYSASTSACLRPI